MIFGGTTHAGYLGFVAGTNTQNDVYKLALYTADAALDRRTKQYTPIGEVRGKGYTQGGIILTGYTTGQEDEGVYLTWTGPIRWANADIAARGALLYNASKDNLALSVFDFGEEFISKNGAFIIPNPPAALATAMIALHHGEPA